MGCSGRGWCLENSTLCHCDVGRGGSLCEKNLDPPLLTEHADAYDKSLDKWFFFGGWEFGSVSDKMYSYSFSKRGILVIEFRLWELEWD